MKKIFGKLFGPEKVDDQKDNKSQVQPQLLDTLSSLPGGELFSYYGISQSNIEDNQNKPEYREQYLRIVLESFIKELFDFANNSNKNKELFSLRISEYYEFAENFITQLNQIDLLIKFDFDPGNVSKNKFNNEDFLSMNKKDIILSFKNTFGIDLYSKLEDLIFDFDNYLVKTLIKYSIFIKFLYKM